MKKFVIGGAMVMLALAVHTQLKTFVVAPIGAKLVGSIVLMPSLNKAEFIDNVDAIYLRIKMKMRLQCLFTVLVAALVSD
ncbi:hypothetical protein V2K57_13260 [Pseudomonas alliivorans]|nr:hypothetical protein [Pseudomonas alliivorans]MEE4701817.1 hypothetical protein [Pseudomonas alliivorans]MEE4737339.1 hypothetical protein [Pseudomonas alliivorans]